MAAESTLRTLRRVYGPMYLVARTIGLSRSVLQRAETGHRVAPAAQRILEREFGLPFHALRRAFGATLDDDVRVQRRTSRSK